jgi:hypothetical protein
MPNKQLIWVAVVSGVVLSGAALVTLRAAEQASAQAQPGHPPPSVPEESATIPDDPTTAPDPSQSADKNVSFPNDI